MAISKKFNKRVASILLAGIVVMWLATVGIFSPAYAAAGTDTLGPDEWLFADQSITSADGRFTLIMQSDGNLVLYQNGVGPLWATDTLGSGADRLVMQSDGNLVVYTPNDGPVWASGTVGESSILKLQDDGNMVIYRGSGGAVWATGSNAWAINQVNGHSVSGSIGEKWISVGGVNSPLGLPITDETDMNTGSEWGSDRYQDFQYGSIYWISATGEVFVVLNSESGCSQSGDNGVGAACAALTSVEDLPGEELPDGYETKVVINGYADVTDDEGWLESDEHGHYEINWSAYLNSDTREVQIGSELPCTGGEVRVVPNLRVTVGNRNWVVLEGEVQLYEGTSCATDDLESTVQIRASVAPNNLVSIPPTTVLNSGFGGGDHADLHLKLSQTKP